jgi:hypothetical protein
MNSELIMPRPESWSSVILAQFFGSLWSELCTQILETAPLGVATFHIALRGIKNSDAERIA